MAKAKLNGVQQIQEGSPKLIESNVTSAVIAFISALVITLIGFGFNLYKLNEVEKAQQKILLEIESDKLYVPRQVKLLDEFVNYINELDYYLNLCVMKGFSHPNKVKNSKLLGLIEDHFNAQKSEAYEAFTTLHLKLIRYYDFPKRFPNLDGNKFSTAFSNYINLIDECLEKEKMTSEYDIARYHLLSIVENVVPN